jgi:ABC-2 type transport system ATP-binding protein
MITATAPLLDVRGISRSFGKLLAVDDLSFTVEAGQVTGFIGPNGAGKTTTMRILATLDLPDEGDALIAGRSVLVEPIESRMRLGFMADRFLPYPNLTVVQFLDFMARAYGLRGDDRTRTVGSVMEFCGLDTLQDRTATKLSKGMGQRLHLAKTLLHDPGLLVLDEPASGLDPRARVEFRDLVRALAEAGKGILISSHLLAELAETCDSVVLIERGKLVVAGGIRDIARKIRSHREVEVHVEGDGEAAERFLLTRPLVHEVAIVDRAVRFDFEGEDGELADLLAAMVGAGIRVYDFHHVETGLEEIFLRTTEGRVQ